VPAQSKHHFHQTIGETRVAGPWAGKHWATIRQFYKPAPHFGLFEQRFESLFAAADKLDRLSDINALFIRAICEILHIRTDIRQANEFDAADEPTQRLVDLSLAVGATRYLTGPSAASYLDVALFHGRDIEVCFVNYDGYPEYPQPPPPFEHGVTILDLLFHTGEKALDYMKDLTPHDG